MFCFGGFFVWFFFGGVSRFFSGLWIFSPVNCSVGVLFQMEIKRFYRIHD